MEMQFSKMATEKKFNNLCSLTFFITFGVLSFFSLVNTVDSAFTIKSDVRRKSLSSAEKLNFEEIGNPSELAWQAWLLVDNQGDSSKRNGGSFDSASILRRITPKSIFIAPPLPACAEGYQADTMNRCVKTVDINQEAHIDFLLQRLNAMYANFGVPLSNPEELSSSSSSSSSSSAAAAAAAESTSSGSSGPLQVNIPLIIDPVGAEISLENSDDSLKKPSVLSVFTAASDYKESENFKDKTATKPESPEEDEAILSIYEGIKNESAGYEQLIPIMEFVEDVNSNFSDIVDYKTSIAIEQMNKTAKNNTKTKDKDNDDDDYDSNGKEHEQIANDTNRKSLNSSNVSPQPTLFLILSPTNSPMINITADIKINNNITLKKIPINVETNDDNSKNRDAIRFNSPTVSTITRGTTTSGSTLLNTEAFDENTKEDTGYDNDGDDDDEYSEDARNGEAKKKAEQTSESQTQNFEESTENEDEILSHSEAGLMVTFSPTKFTQLYSGFSEYERTDGDVTVDVTTNDDFDTEMASTDVNYKEIIKKDDRNVDAIRSDNSKTNSARETSNDTNFDESKIEKLSTLFDESTETIDGDDLTTLPTTTTEIRGVPEQVSSSHPSVQTIEEFSEQQLKASSSDQTIVTVSKSSVTFPQNDAEKIETKKPEMASIAIGSSEPIALSSTNAAETFESQKLVFSTPKKNDITIDKQTMDNIHSAVDVKFPTSTDKQSNPYDYYPVPFDYLHVNNRKSVLDEDEKLEVKPASAVRFESNKDVQKNSSPYNLEPSFHPIDDRDYIKFPMFERQHNRPNYVRFPSEQVNSIHTPNDFNDKYYYRQYSEQPNFQPIPLKSGIENYKAPNKQSYRAISANRRVNRQESPAKLTVGQNDKKKADRPRMVLEFWSRMPLLQDTTTKQQHQQQQQQQQEHQQQQHAAYVLPKNTQNIYSGQQRMSRRHSSRSVNFYNQISPINVTRSYARSLPIRS